MADAFQIPSLIFGTNTVKLSWKRAGRFSDYVIRKTNQCAASLYHLIVDIKSPLEISSLHIVFPPTDLHWADTVSPLNQGVASQAAEQLISGKSFCVGGYCFLAEYVRLRGKQKRFNEKTANQEFGGDSFFRTMGLSISKGLRVIVYRGEGQGST
jgi:hypothetical protein